MKLLEPIRLGRVEVKNRVVQTAHSAFVDFWQKGNDGQRYIGYVERRARGGCGMLILTAMHVHASSQKDAHFVYDAADMAPKYRELASRAHAHGARLVQQLFHYGATGKSEARDDFHPLWGMSAITSSLGETAHAMTEEEIEEVRFVPLIGEQGWPEKHETFRDKPRDRAAEPPCRRRAAGPVRRLCLV